MSYIEVTGKTEDEAIANALRQLGLERDDVSVQVLERAKSGFLGLGSQPAKIRVTYGLAEEEPEEAPVPEKEPEPAAIEKPRQTERPQPEEKEKPKAPREPRQRKPDRKPETAQRPEKMPAERAAEKPAPVQELGEEDEKAQAIRKFLTGLLEQMDSPAEVHVYLPEKGRYRVILSGKDLGGLIGRRGETLDAIQQLTSYSVNRTGGGRVRVQLDAENYRERREQSLRHLAQKVAGKVVRYRRSVTLEPMNAYERHVIHTALQDTPGVTTYSTGVDPNRRVIVAYDAQKR